VSLRDLHADLRRLVSPVDPSPDPIARARDHLLDSLDQPHTTASLARDVGVSERHLRRRFRETYGQTLRGELTALRLRRAAELLRRTGLGVKQVAYTIGFPSLRSFERAFKGAFGVTPSEYRTRSPEGGPEDLLADSDPWRGGDGRK
jgi:transcriptional regulator GlxA family with amidase domain